MKEDENVVNVATEQEQKERQKIGEEKTALINEIKQFANAIDSEVIGTHLYEVGYRKIIYRDMTEVLNHEIEQLKEENDKLKCNCFRSFKDPETCETIVNGVKFSNEQVIVLSAYINNYQAIRQEAVEEFSRKVFKIIDELYGVEGSRRFQEIRGQYLKVKINDLLKGDNI